MIRALYNKDRLVDEMFEQVIGSITKGTSNKEDDFLLLCCGPPGTGKSHLMLHAMSIYLKDNSSAKYIGLNKNDFATALKDATGAKLPRMCVNDEADVSKRDALTKYNKHLISLYLAIRGLRIFHWWNNPSIDMIDKQFIEERIKGMIYIATKDMDRPRLYYYFTKQDMLKIWEKYGNLKLNLLQKIKKEYACYRGWFKAFPDCDLLREYLEKKESRMDEKIEEFFDMYGRKDDHVKHAELIKRLEINEKTLKNWRTELIANGKITEKDFHITAAGRVSYPQKTVLMFEEYANNKHKHHKYNILDSILEKKDEQ